MHREEQFARQPQQFAASMMGNIDHSRRIGPIDDFVSDIRQGEHGSALGKIMKVRVLSPPEDHTFLPKNVLHRNVERDMQKFVLGTRFEFPQKTAIVLDVREYV